MNISAKLRSIIHQVFIPPVTSTTLPERSGIVFTSKLFIVATATAVDLLVLWLTLVTEKATHDEGDGPSY